MAYGRSFIPALRYRVLTPLFDPFIDLLFNQKRLRSDFVRIISPQPEEILLDFGCGTGSLLLAIKQSEPACTVHGIDIDPDVLSIAKRKAAAATIPVRLTRYSGSRLPYPDGTFHKAVSSLVFHHLDPTEVKGAALQELYRVLAPGGFFHLLDFGPQHSRYGRAITSLLSRAEPLGDNLSGKLHELLLKTGFSEVTETLRYDTLLGTLIGLSGRKCRQ